jgi:hypothetical protein
MADNNEAAMCTCGHVHAPGEKCTAVVSGAPVLTYCVCPGLTRPGEHQR